MILTIEQYDLLKLLVVDRDDVAAGVVGILFCLDGDEIFLDTAVIEKSREFTMKRGDLSAMPPTDTVIVVNFSKEPA